MYGQGLQPPNLELKEHGASMLRTISTDVPFRDLHTQPFGEGDAACVLGKRTVV